MRWAAPRLTVEGKIGEPSDDGVPREQDNERSSRGEMRPEDGLARAPVPHEVEEIAAVGHDEYERDEEDAARAVEAGLEVALHVAVGGTGDRGEKRRRRECMEPEPPRLRRVAEDGKILFRRVEGVADVPERRPRENHRKRREDNRRVLDGPEPPAFERFALTERTHGLLPYGGSRT